MTKKRYKKLLMSTGLQRNEAEARAKEVAKYGSYKALFHAGRIGFVVGGLQKAWKMIGVSFNTFVEQIVKLNEAMCAGVSADGKENP